MRFLREWKESIKNDFALGRFLDPEDAVKSACRNADALGQIGMIDALLELNYETVKGLLDGEADEEPIGPEANG